MILPGPAYRLTGRIAVPGSKSLTNRALVAAAVAGGGIVTRPLDCDDTRVLAGALQAAGWELEWDDEIRIGGRAGAKERKSVWLGDSGTGSRLMLGLLAATPGRFEVDGSARLRERPMAPLVTTLQELGAEVRPTPGGGLPVTIDGRRLRGGAVSMRPEVSSQFVTALLLAAPLMERGLELEVIGSLPSRPYVDLTVDILNRFGVRVEHARGSRRWRVPPGAARPTTLAIEGDWSACAFYVAAVSIADGSLELARLDPTSRQGDRVVCDVARNAGVTVRTTASGATVSGRAQRPFAADLTHAPDTFPALAAMAACGPPGSRLEGLDHLKHKESDRLTVMVDNLRRLGARIEVGHGTADFVGSIDRAPRAETRAVTSAGDHRVAMAMAVVSLVGGPLDLDDGDCVAKSYPGFWDTWSRLLEGGGA